MIGEDPRRAGHGPQRIPALRTVFGHAVLRRDRQAWALFWVAPCGCRDLKAFGRNPMLTDVNTIEVFLVKPCDPG